MMINGFLRIFINLLIVLIYLFRDILNFDFAFRKTRMCLVLIKIDYYISKINKYKIKSEKYFDKSDKYFRISSKYIKEIEKYIKTINKENNYNIKIELIKDSDIDKTKDELENNISLGKYFDI